MIADVEIGARLLDTLRRGRSAAVAAQRQILVSVVESIDAIDPLDAFGRCREPERFYWRPAEGPALAGCGCAYALRYHSSRLAEEEWRAVLDGAIVEGPEHHATGPLLMGSLAFDPLRPRTSLWDGFPLERLVLPRILVTRGEQSCVTMNVMIEPESDVERLARDLAEEVGFLLSGHAHSFSPPSRTQVLDATADTFRSVVAEAVDVIRRGSVDKIVVARPVEVQGTWCLTDVLRRLRQAQPGCTTFAVAQGDVCFVGATPEWLVRLRNGEARISCLAGTAARGQDEEEDRRLGDELLSSHKDRREHTLVRDMILSSLAGLALEIQMPDAPTLMKLPNLQHLSTPITAVIAGRTVLSLVKRLHPTPAVAGFPREPAMTFLRQHEGLDRGAYAGPVGWMDRRGEGEFAVALRSALLREEGATAFAGCGIVPDSDPDRELIESCLKLRPILNALGAPCES